ncbi:MAG TPA: class I SAM-dependent methyltransferase [Acetobacteraceae bacterium]|nr:class I SAM-dependent methyltransferase [Acetobacteraceae bacterium]
MTRLNLDAVRAAYQRHAGTYDQVFGALTAPGQRRAVAAVNALPGRDVLEVGVGTGLALPRYARDKRITGIDLSAHMLARARARVASRRLTNVAALLELDAEDTGLPAASFDIAVAMFVASVVPHPDRLLGELRRLVRPGGHILFVNHFSAANGLRLAIERGLAPLAHKLGWHPDFPVDALLPTADIARATFTPAPPFGIFTLVHLPLDGPPAPR